MESFPQLPAVKKDSKNGAARKFFGPSYFVTALLLRVFFHIFIAQRWDLPFSVPRVHIFDFLYPIDRTEI